MVDGKIIGYQTRFSDIHRTNHRGRSSSTYSYYPEIAFENQQGNIIRFISRTGSNHQSYAMNETVQVRYELGHPQSAELDYFSNIWLGDIILLVFGIGLTSFGSLKFYFDQKKKALYAELKRTGKKIPVKFERVEQMENTVKINNRSPYRIVAYIEKKAGVKGKTFYSHKLWKDPTLLLEGRQLYVYIDKNDLNRYVMDLDFLQ